MSVNKLCRLLGGQEAPLAGDQCGQEDEVDARVHSERRHHGASPPSLNVKIKPTLPGNE